MTVNNSFKSTPPFLSGLFILSLVVSNHTRAAPQSIQIGPPQIQGTGCSPQTSAVALSPDGTELSLIYDDFRIGTDQNQNTGRANCTQIIPISIPNGYLLKVTKADYRGFNSLPDQSVSEFFSEYRFIGENNPETKKRVRFVGPLLSEFYETHQIHSKSPCSQRVSLMINTQIIIENKNTSQNAFLQIDTLDMTQPQKKKDRKAKFQLSLKKCSEER